MSNNDLLWLRIARTKGINKPTLCDICNLFDNPSDILEYIKNLSKKSSVKTKISIFSEENALDEYNKTLLDGAYFINCQSSAYPKLLKNIPDFPIVLVAKGNSSILNENCVAMVGSRNASFHGKRMADILSQHLGNRKLTIVSGLARGIDQAAHRSSLKSGTIAVMGCGIDEIYPKENKELYNQIIDNSGIIITELPINSKPNPKHFPQRNRIIAGMSIGTVVVEATTYSGSLITAKLANEYNRELFVVPGFPLDPRYTGNNSLIKKNIGKLIESGEDIYREIIEQLDQSFASENKSRKIDKFAIDVLPTREEIDTTKKQILNLLSSIPACADDLNKELIIPIKTIRMSLIELELEGLVQRTHSGEFVTSESGETCLFGITED